MKNSSRMTNVNVHVFSQSLITWDVKIEFYGGICHT